MTSESPCQLCGGAHAKGECTEKREVKIDRGNVELLRKKILDLTAHEGGVDSAPKSDQEKARALEEQLPNFQLHFLVDLHFTDKTLVPAKTVQSFLDTITPEYIQALQNVTVAQQLAQEYIRIQMLQGAHEEAYQEFERYIADFPSQKGFAITMFHDALLIEKSSEDWAARYEAVAASSAKPGLLQHMREKWEKLKGNKKEIIDETVKDFNRRIARAYNFCGPEVGDAQRDFVRQFIPGYTVSYENAAKPKPESQPRDPSAARAHKIKKLMKRPGNYANGKTMLAEELRKNPDDSKLLLLAFGIALDQKNEEAAAALYRKLVSLPPESKIDQRRLEERLSQAFRGSRNVYERSPFMDNVGSLEPINATAHTVTHKPHKGTKKT